MHRLVHREIPHRFHLKSQLGHGIFRLLKLLPGCRALHGQHGAAHPDKGCRQLQQDVQPCHSPAGRIIKPLPAAGRLLLRPGGDAPRVGNLQRRKRRRKPVHPLGQ